MFNYPNNGYNNTNNWLNNQPYNNFIQPQTNPLNVNFVSNVAEAVATKPDVNGRPTFFYNKADEEFYIKQYDNTGAAPIRTYKLVIASEQQPENNPYMQKFQSLDEKLEDIKKLLTPMSAPVEEDKKNRR